MFRWTTSGESHGQALVALAEGLPAGTPINRERISTELARRRLGYGRGARMKFEADELTILAGSRFGRSIGGPLAIMIGNTEWPKWTTIMSPEELDESDPQVAQALASGRGAKLTRPRPGHADLAGMLKYDFDEARPVLERSSARETAARVALGAVAKDFLAEALGATVVSHVVAIGSSKPYRGQLPGPEDLEAIDRSPVRSFPAEAEAQMIAEIESAKKSGDTLGGVVEVVVWGLPVGLGTHATWHGRLDGRLAQALMSIQSVKAVEIGDGFDQAACRGSQAHDEIAWNEGTAAGSTQLGRLSNRAGGLEGGMTNGQPVVCRVGFKPISTVPRALRTIDMSDGSPAKAIHQRSDVCAVPAGGVVAESMVALTVLGAVLDKFGGDTLDDTRRAVADYRTRVARRLDFSDAGQNPHPDQEERAGR